MWGLALRESFALVLEGTNSEEEDEEEDEGKEVDEKVEQQGVSDGGDKDDHEEEQGRSVLHWYSVMDKTSVEEYYYTDEGTVQWHRPTKHTRREKKIGQEDRPPLPVGWYSVMDKTSDEEYYYTTEGTVQWDHPTNLSTRREKKIEVERFERQTEHHSGCHTCDTNVTVDGMTRALSQVDFEGRCHR